jgi:hypothetical protein
LAARLHADRLRKEWPDDAADSPAVKSHAAMMRSEAKQFDAIGDLLLGLQGCWEHHGGAAIVRDGFKLMSRSYDKSKTYVLAVEASVEEPKADEVAA